MKRTIHKWFWVWDFDKEERWLNEMSAKGLQLCGVGYFRYTFEEGTPGEYIYRLEMLDDWPTSAAGMQYIHFLEDTGAEHIGSLLRWVYFRKKAGDIGFDLFSDIDSRIRHLNRILFLTGILAALNLFNGFNSLLNSFSHGITVVAALICTSIGLILSCGSLRIYLKRRHLKKEKVLHE